MHARDIGKLPAVPAVPAAAQYNRAPLHVLFAPPSTAMVWPVMKSLSAEARNTSAPNKSSGYSSRLMARRAIDGPRECSMWPGFSFTTVSDNVKPGASVLTQMLYSPSSRDTARVNAVTAPFDET